MEKISRLRLAFGHTSDLTAIPYMFSSYSIILTITPRFSASGPLKINLKRHIGSPATYSLIQLIHVNNLLWAGHDIKFRVLAPSQTSQIKYVEGRHSRVNNRCQKRPSLSGLASGPWLLQPLPEGERQVLDLASIERCYSRHRHRDLDLECGSGVWIARVRTEQPFSGGRHHVECDMILFEPWPGRAVVRRI